jgi:DNA polymerase-4
VETQRESKSISQETTFNRDLSDGAKLRQVIEEQAQGVANELRRKRLLATTVKLKPRWHDFTTLTRQTTFTQPTAAADQIGAAALRLFQATWHGELVRLVGVGVSGLNNSAQQLSLWEDPQEQAVREKETRLQQTLQMLRQRYGDDAIQRGWTAADE